MILKKQFDQNRLFLVVYDSNLKGKTLEEDQIIIDLSSPYFEGEELPEENIKEWIAKAYYVQCIGKESCNIANLHDTKTIQEIPYGFITR